MSAKRRKWLEEHRLILNMAKAFHWIFYGVFVTAILAMYIAPVLLGCLGLYWTFLFWIPATACIGIAKTLFENKNYWMEFIK